MGVRYVLIGLGLVVPYASVNEVAELHFRTRLEGQRPGPDPFAGIAFHGMFRRIPVVEAAGNADTIPGLFQGELKRNTNRASFGTEFFKNHLKTEFGEERVYAVK